MRVNFRKTIAALLISVAVSVSAYAALPMLYLAIGSSIALHAAFGLVYDYFHKPVVTSTGTIKAVIKLNKSANNADIAAQQGTVEAKQDLLPTPPYYMIIPCPSTYCKRSAPVTINGATVDEILDKMATCPSDVCVFGGNVSSMLSPSARGYVSSSKGYLGASALPYLRVTYTNGVTVDFQANGFTCNPGYNANMTTGQCDLADIPTARNSGGRDGVCILEDGVPNLQDKDCQYLQNNNYMRTSTTSSGKRSTSVSDPSGDKTTVSQTQADDGVGTVVSQLKPSSDGGQRREDTYVGPTGEVGTTNTTNYPNNPPPKYPGDTGTGTGTGTGSGGQVGTGSVGGCGAAGQKPCAVTLEDGDGTTHSESDLPDGSAAADFDKTETFLDPIRDKLKGFFDFKMPPHTSSCPSLSISWHVWGLELDSRSNFMCELLANNQQLIKSLVQFAYIAGAIIIVLGA